MKESRSKTEPVYKLLQDNLVCREKKLKEKKMSIVDPEMNSET